MATKTFVLSLDSFLTSPGITQNFDKDNEIVLPKVVLECIQEYDGVPEKTRIAIQFLEYLSSFNAKELSTKGVIQENGSTLKILENSSTFSSKFDNSKNLDIYSKRVLQVCRDLQEEGKNVVLISQTYLLRYHAECLGITAQPLRDSYFPPLAQQYTGMAEISLSKNQLNELNVSEKGLNVSTLACCKDLIENQYVLINSFKPARYTNGFLVNMNTIKTYDAYIDSKNPEQQMLFDALLAPPYEIPLVIIKGGAGTGKTFCSLTSGLCMLKKYSSSEIYDQILVASPTIGMDDDIGFLPGTLEEKVGPYLGGITDNIKQYFKSKDSKSKPNELEDKCSELFDRKYIIVESLRFLRGRSITDTFFIVDEAQNIPVDIILDILTRIGTGSKLILMGDPSQVNRKGLTTSYNGLTYASEIMKGSKFCSQVTLNSSKSIRSPLAQDAINRIHR